MNQLRTCRSGVGGLLLGVLGALLSALPAHARENA